MNTAHPDHHRPPAHQRPPGSHHRGRSYRLLLTICIGVLVSFTLPAPWSRLSSLGYLLLGGVMLRAFSPVHSSMGRGVMPKLLYRISGVAALASSLIWYLTPVELKGTGIPLLGLWTLFSVWSAIRLIEALAQEREVGSDVMRGALAGYLMLGLSGGLLCSALETIVPGSFESSAVGAPGQPLSGPVWGLNFVRLNYYAFVTLTTTGYGDVAPLTPLAQMISVAIAVAGTTYLTVVLGLLISRFSHDDHRRSGG